MGLKPASGVPRTDAPSRSYLRSWASALRPHQWSKNLLIFLPLLLARQFDGAALATVAAGFLLFCLVASAIYLINDLADLEFDRAHPSKYRRALAAREISQRGALGAAAILLLGAIGAAMVLSPAFGSVLAAYVGLNLLYSFSLKRVPLVDVVLVGALITMRLVGGMLLLGQPISLWLSGFGLALFTALAMAKRHSELVRAVRDSRPAPPGRGYTAADLPLTLVFGLGSAAAAVIVVALYFRFEAAATRLYPALPWLYAVPPVLVSWLARIWLRARRGELDSDPVIFALRDPVSWAHAAAIIALWVAASAG